MSAFPVRLRVASRADAAALGGLHVHSWRETYAGLLPDDRLAGLSVDRQTAMWDGIFAVPEDSGCIAILIAEIAREAAGFGACGPQRDGALAQAGFGGEFGAIYVLRRDQGRGVGRALMRAMAEALNAAGHRGASL